MPPRSPRGRRKARHTNVFVQENQPKADEELEDEVELEADNGNGAAAVTPAATRTRRIRAQRASRQARVRSEVFTRTLGKELRKVGILSGGIIAALVALTFVLD